ncbi:MAG: autoinducer binding domain-containing protein, partial [Paracoccaceae bacterium]
MLSYLEQLNEAQSIDEVWALHVEKMAGFGFDRLFYGFTQHRTSNSFGDRDDLLLLTNHSDEYVRHFIDGGMYFNAPMVRWAAENVGACSWGWMEKNAGSLSEAERKVIAFNRSMGVTAGYSVSFKDISPRAKGAIALTAQAGTPQDAVDALWQKSGREIIQMNNVVHLKLTSLPY